MRSIKSKKSRGGMSIELVALIIFLLSFGSAVVSYSKMFIVSHRGELQMQNLLEERIVASGFSPCLENLNSGQNINIFSSDRIRKRLVFFTTDICKEVDHD